MKAIRVSKLKNELENINPNNKVWFSIEEPTFDIKAEIRTVSDEDFQAELERRNYVKAFNLFAETAGKLESLGFHMSDFL